MDDIASVKSMLRAVLMSCKEGVPAHILQRDYREMTGEPLPFRKLGYSNLDDFIFSIPDVVHIRKNNQGETTYHAKASQQTAHIQNMVSKQRNAKKKRKLTPLKRKPAPQTSVPRPLYHGNSHPPNQYRNTQYHSRSNSYPKPSHRSPLYSPPNQSYSGLQVRLSDTPNQTNKQRSVTFDRIGHKTLSKALSEANSERNEERLPFGSRFDVPPRFRKLQRAETSRPALLKTPVKKAPPHRLEKTEFDTVLNGRQFYERLEKYALQNFDVTSLAVEFNTIPVKIGGSQGYVSSLTFRGKVYGSEDAFATPEEATYAVARKVCLDLDTNKKRDSSPTDRRSVSESVLKSRVKELLCNKANGLWKKRLMELYKEQFKEDPPDHLFSLIKQWNDIATIQESAVPDNEIITPVSGTSQGGTKPVSQTHKSIPRETTQTSPVVPRKTYQSPLPPTPATITESRQKAENSSVKDLKIPKGEPLPLEEKVTVYVTFFHNCGYFCVQREDSPIDEISTLLSLQASDKKAKPTRQELSPGQFCASMYSTDGSWSRAEVLAKDEIGCGVEVLYVDFGNTEECFPSSMQWLCEKSASFPVQAVYCCLHGVKPLKGEDWSAESQQKFLELTREEALVAVTHGFKEDGVCEVELFYSDPDKTVSINQMMIESGVLASIDQAEPSMEPDDIMIPETSQLDVYVSFVNSSTDSVILRLVGDNFSEKLDELETKLEVAFHAAPEDGSIEEGCVFVAYVDGLFHRVRVLENEGRKIKCHFLDHGDTDMLIPDQLRLLDPELNKSLPYQAIEVSLYGLEEVSENITVLESLFDFALGKTCVAEVVSREECLSVILFDTFGQEDVNINELIAKTYKEASATSLLTSHSSPLGSVANLLDRPSDTADRPLDSSLSNKSVDTKSSSVSSLSDASDGVTSPNRPEEKPDSHHLSPESSYHATLATKLETGQKAGNEYVGQKLTPAQQYASTNVRSETPASVKDKLLVRQKSSDSWETEESEEEIGEEISDEKSEDINQNSVEIKDFECVSVTEKTADEKSVIVVSDDANASGGGNVMGEEIVVTDDVTSMSGGDILVEKAQPSSLYTWGTGKQAAKGSDEDLWDKEAYHRRKVPPRHTLPQNGQFCDIHVGLVFDPANFVITPFDTMSDIQRLHQELNDYMSETQSQQRLSEEEVKLGHLYAGQQEECWYRTMVRQAVGPELFSVYFPDLGEFNVVDTSELLPLPLKFWSLPFQAFKAKLDTIRPAKHTGFWTEGAIFKMKELTEGRNLVGLVRGIDDKRVVSLSLVDTSDENIDICIEDVLIEFGFAEPS
ncbi:tudor domain-containing protein 7B-like [Ylistrum balloti]|uniref:tudor domain-containing protein 7B-like n=1 Tax=Ylistrum balloti TaxID=509963 RepID=UPI0029058D0D|nr:tudor domain-containing protein 7B-like [Ylistrum balloti]